MKKFTSLILIICLFNILNFQILTTKSKNMIEDSCEMIAIEQTATQIDTPTEQNDELAKLENFKRTYLKIIENLSFRNTLWEQSSNYIKINDRDEIANLWASGIRDKNGALLYLISNENIQTQLKNVFRDNPSWFIEQNEHQIQSFEVKKTKKISKNLFCYEIIYKAINNSSTKLLKQTLCIEQCKNYSKICEFSNIIPLN